VVQEISNDLAQPVVTTFSILAKAYDRWAVYGNCRLNCCALADVGEIGHIQIPGDDDGQASLVRQVGGSWAEATIVTDLECEIRTLDDYARTYIKDRLEFIKCDVEGAELLVLRGGEETICKFSPLLYLEACTEWAAQFGYHPTHLVQHLRRKGYNTFYWIGAYDGMVRPLKTGSEHLWPGENGNLLCGIYERHHARLKTLPVPRGKPGGR
jgi:FkbM family methyltransferase